MAIDYSQLIPNNVNLYERPPAAARARELAAALPRLVEGDGARRHLEPSTSICAPRSRVEPNGWAQLRLREDAGLSLGHLPGRPRSEPRRSTSATTRASPPGRRCRARYRSTAAPPDRHAGRHRARARSSSSACSARPRRRSTTCATSSRSTSRKAATSGRWSICCTPISAATAARRPRRCWSATRAIPTSRASSAPSTRRRRLAVVLHVHLSSPTATASTSSPSLAESGFDPLARTCRFMLTEEAHHMFVGETGVSRIVQRTCELMKEHKTDDVRSVRRHRPADHAEVPQLPLLDVARPVRPGGLDQRRQLLHRWASRAVTSRPSRRRPPARRRDLRDREVEDGRIVKKAVAGPATRSTSACATITSTTASAASTLEQDDQERGHLVRAEAAEPRLPPQIGGFAGVRISPDGKILTEAEWNAQQGRVAADRRGPGLHHVADGRASPSPASSPTGSRRRHRGINRQPVDFEYVRFN